MTAISPPRRHRLLIVDDDVQFRETLRYIFQSAFDLVEAECGEQALELAERTEFDLALLDMHMRVLTGLETLQILRSRLVVAPCILITADATDELRRTAIAVTAFAVLKKPVRKQELVSAVTAALGDAYPAPPAGGTPGFGSNRVA